MFYDDIMAEFSKSAEMRSMETLFKPAKVIKAHNVLEYYAHSIDDQIDFNKQLGVLAPPFNVSWIEMDHPERITIAGQEIDWPSLGFERAGVFLLSARKLDGWNIQYTIFFDFSFVEIPKTNPKIGGWWPYPYLLGEFNLDANGFAVVTNGNVFSLQQPSAPVDVRMQEATRWGHGIVADVMTLSLSFINCKNVVLDEVQPETPTQTAEEKRRNIWPKLPHSFHTIRIEPFKTRTKTGETVGEGSTMRLHIVRGHFHTYSADKPLFGNPKLVGQFWIPQHRRGDAAEGDIDAEYDIKP